MKFNEDDFMCFANEITKLAKDFHFKNSYEYLHPKKYEEELINFWDMQLPESPSSIENVLNDLHEGFMPGLTGITNPKFLGYILTRPNPESFLFDILANATHATPSLSLLSASGTLVERCALRWLAQGLGIEEFIGLFTSGGSESNLLSIKIARDLVINRFQGVQKDVIVYSSNNTHYSIQRAWDVLGCGINNVKSFDINKIDELCLDIEKDIKEKKIVTGIIGTLGTSNTGIIEPLDRLLKVAKEFGIFYHIDAAYGGACLLLEEYKHLHKVIREADSLSFDPHKWIGMPMGTGVIFLNPRHSYYSSYKFSADVLDYKYSETEIPNQCEMGIEGTRPLRGLKVWGALKLLGFDEIKRRIKICIERAEYLKMLISQNPKLKLNHESGLSIVTFSIKNASKESLNLIVNELYNRNKFFVTVIKINNKHFIRCAIISYETDNKILENFIFEINELMVKYVKK